MKKVFTLLIVLAMLMFTGLTDANAATILVPTNQPTIQDAINAASPGDIIQVEATALTITAQVIVNKANLTIQGVSNTSSKIQVSGTVTPLFLVTADGVTIQNLEIEKTDKVGEQNIIGIQASNVTIKNNIIHGQFVFGDGDISRAIVISGGLSGLLIDNNQFYNLRQPAYISGTTTGTVSNNYTNNTKGWVLEGGNLTFTGNTWGVNVYDIAIIPAMPAIYYTDIVAMSNANNGAVIEDQRVSPAVLSVVYVDASTAFSSDLGGTYHPYPTIAPAITRVVAGGTIKVAAGVYAEGLSVNKSVTIEGPNSLINPNTATRVPEAILKPNSGSHALLGAANSVNFTIKGITIDMVNTTTDNRFVHIINFTDNSWSFRNNILTNAKGCVNGNWYISGNTTGFNLALNENLFVNSATSNGIALFSANTHTIDVQNNVWMDNGAWAMNFNNVHGTIANNTFKNSVAPGAVWSAQQTGFIIASTNNDVNVTGNTFESLSGTAISFYDNAAGKLAITNNTFSNIANYGAVRPKIGSDVSQLTVTGNSFSNNLLNIQNLTTGTLAATCNWWGTAVASEITAKFVGSVDYAPYSVSEGGTCTGYPPPTPITNIGASTSTTCGTLDVPVTVKNFKDVGAISLVLNYDPSKLQLLSMVPPFQGITLNPAIAGALVSGDNTTGQFRLADYPVPAIMLGDDAVLFTLHFNVLPSALGGTATPLNWSTVSQECEYAGTGGEPKYVSTFNNGSATIPTRPVKNINTGREYCTIQAAINDPATNDGAGDHDVITVAAGTYIEAVLVNKSLTITGAQAGVDPRSTGTVARAGGESIVLPPVVNTAAEGTVSFTIAANNVTIDGFTLDGSNPALTGGTEINGVNIHAARGIYNLQTLGVNYLTVKNNIVKNFYRQGIYLYSPTYLLQQNNMVEKNIFDNIHRLSADGTGTAAYMEQEAAITVKNNKMTRVGRGIMTATLGTFVNVPFELSNNDITSYITGIWVNNHHSAAPVCTVADNILNSEATSTTNDGMRITSMFVANELVISNNVINAKRYGYRVWNLPSNTVKISGGSVTGATQGIYASNYYSGFGDATSTSFMVDGVNIQNSSSQAICIDDDAANTNSAIISAEIENVIISGSATGVQVKGADAGASIHGNSITASVLGIDVTGVVTSASNALSIFSNQIILANQLSGSNPTAAILLSKVTGTVEAVIYANDISGSYYGYLVYNLNTLPKTVVMESIITGVRIGLAAMNIDPAGSGTRASSNFYIWDMTMSGFAAPNGLQAGVYIYTGGDVENTSITATIHNVSVSGTGKTQSDCAGFSFADFSTLASAGQNITVTECTLTDNLNRGIGIRGANADVQVFKSTLTGNGKDAHTATGSFGQGIVAFAGGKARVVNCFITNPASSTSAVSALFTFPYGTPELGGTINATNNSLDRNGNGLLANNAGGTLNATCNWLGSTVPATNAAAVSGTVLYNPWLCSGDDQDLATAGFQGVPCGNGALAVPENGSANVECLASAVPPETPVVYDVDGTTPLTPVLVSTVDLPDPIICEGTRTYTYSYTNCSGMSAQWSFVYTIVHVTPPVVPVNSSKTVACPADAVNPALLSTIPDQQQLLFNTSLATPYWTDFTSIGQSFTCGTSGWLTQLDLRVGNLAGAQSFTLQIFQGNGIAGTLLYTGSHSLTATGWQSLNIAQELAPYLTAGTQYTFWLTSFTYNQLGLFCMYPNVYNGGVSMDGCTTGCSPTYAWKQWPDYDLVFKTYMTAVPIVKDVCGTVIPTPTPVESGTYNGCEGTKVYTYTYTDCAGLQTPWVFTYTIERNDFTMPANGTSTVACASNVVTPTPPAVNDACGNAITPVPGTLPTAPVCEGTMVYTWTYTDCEGNNHIWSHTVTIDDNVVPTITCPAAIEVHMNTDCNYIGAIGTPVATDNCGGTVAITNNVPVTGLPIGANTVTWTATDCAGNIATCTQIVTVVKNTLSGTLVYNNTAKTPMNLVKMVIKDATNTQVGAEVTTTSAGAFTFPDLCAGTYTIHVTYNAKDAGGINATDAAQVNKWSTNFGAIEHVKFLAGDVTFNKWLDSGDALKIQGYFVFPGNPVYAITPKWSYWKKGELITNNTTPYNGIGAWPPHITVTITGDLSGLELYGMLNGDFDGSLVPEALKSANPSLTLAENSNLQIGASQAFELPLRAASAMQVGAVSMILDIPSELVTVQNVKIKGSNDPVMWAINGNELRIGWHSLNPVNVAENGALVTLELMATSAFAQGRTLDIALPFNQLNELADGNFEAMKNAELMVAKVGNMTVGNIAIDRDGGLQFSNYPNPFSQVTTLEYNLPVDGKVTINLFNNLGQLVSVLVDADQSAGQHTFRYESNTLQPGIYVAKLRLVNSETDLVGTIKLSVQK